jgi:hypothetical protein
MMKHLIVAIAIWAQLEYIMKYCSFAEGLSIRHLPEDDFENPVRLNRNTHKRHDLHLSFDKWPWSTPASVARDT